MLRLSGASHHAARALRIASLTEAATKRVVALGQLGPPSPTPCCESSKRRFGSARRLWQSTAATSAVASDVVSQLKQPDPAAIDFAKTLPVVCPGCGGMSQTVDSEVAGFYSPKKRNIKKGKVFVSGKDEDEIFEQAMARLSSVDQASVMPDVSAAEDVENVENDRPLLCDRCHDLIHQSKGQSILHPSMDSIRDIIESSPHRDNHIYHVLDAADFPMSLIPNLIAALDLPRLRTQNRRSKSRQYIRGRKAEISFIITRSDLLAPRKEDVDRLMPYLQEVLRDALGRTGKNLRLGNVRCVSAKRGWWTPQVKEEIWKRGGAGWVVGKVNVGKSALFEVVYPKGRNIKPEAQAKLDKVQQRGVLDVSGLPESSAVDDQTLMEEERATAAILEDAAKSRSRGDADAQTQHEGNLQSRSEETVDTEEAESVDATAARDDALSSLDEQAGMASEEALSPEEHADAEFDVCDTSLLPPAQRETPYPHMPIVSSLPGTTASPIRIPYGNGKGELIDLPGIQRSSIETHIKPERRNSLVMKSRIVPEQFTLHAGRSLLLGGIIRITPKTDDLIFLAYPFTPLTAHAAGNEKAKAIQTGVQVDGSPYEGTVENIGTDSAKKRIKSAGTFKIEWNATSKRTGSLTDRTAGKRKVDDLPFIVYSADILIESVGWVEIACQVRSRKKSLLSDTSANEFGIEKDEKTDFPEVEVFSPKGKFIGIRRPMNAYITGGPKKVAKHAVKKRPRMSISYQRRMEGGKRGARQDA